MIALLKASVLTFILTVVVLALLPVDVVTGIREAITIDLCIALFIVMFVLSWLHEYFKEKDE